MTITGQSALSKDDIERMVRDAEAHAEEDRTRKEDAEARNQADTMVYQTERMIREDAEANKLTADEKERLEEAIKHLKDSLKGFDLAKVKADTEALMVVTQTVSARLYSEATAASGRRRRRRRPRWRWPGRRRCVQRRRGCGRGDRRRSPMSPERTATTSSDVHDSQVDDQAQPATESRRRGLRRGRRRAPAAPTWTTGSGDELAEAVMSDLDVLAAERDAYYDQLLRTRADFDNFRKRMIKQQTEHLERANEGLIVKLLDVLDVLDGASAHGEGFEQVGARLVGVLEKEGLERIDPVGQEFDPNEADAVAHEPTPGEPAARWCRRCCGRATAGRVGSCDRRW